jgi:hypothetical protein
MLAITSIAPGHKNFENQLKAVQSWKAAGYEVISMNSEEEIELLKDFTDVKFIKTERHNKVLFGKPYVIVSAIIDYLKEVKSTHSLIINSDIIIQDPENITELLKARSEEGIIVMNRGDYEQDINKAKTYELGFDAFFVNGKHLGVFPQTILCLGQCHWDFWFPYIASIGGVKLIRLRKPYIFHAMHNIQYSKENWIRTAEIFRTSEKFLLRYKNISQATAHAYNHIKRHSETWV